MEIKHKPTWSFEFWFCALSPMGCESKTQPFCEGFVKTEEMVIRTVFKEQVMKISMKTVDYLNIRAVTYCCIDKKARNSIICSMTLTGWNIG